MHPLKPITRAQFVTLTDQTDPLLSRRLRDRTICLFSTTMTKYAIPQRAPDGRYNHVFVPADAVMFEITTRLTQDRGISWSALAEPDEPGQVWWLEHCWRELLEYDAEPLQLRRAEHALSALDRAEASDEPMFLLLGQYAEGLSGVTLGSLQDLDDRSGYRGATLVRIWGVNVKEAIREVRTRAKAAEIELPRYWAPPRTREEIEARHPEVMRGRR